jgi:serine/threonine-protein kinase
MNMPMDAARHARIKEVFLEIRVLSRADWPAALERHCQDDLELRKEVESLLAHDQPESLLASRIESPERRVAQVTFDRGATAKWNEEQRNFLYQRIRFLALLISLLVAINALRVFGLFGSWPKLAHLPAAGMVIGWSLLGLTILVLLTLHDASFAALRRIEVALMLSCSLVIFSWSYGWLTNGVTLNQPPSQAVDTLLRKVFWIASPSGITHFQVGSSLVSVLIANQWSLLAGTYGFIIPNTLRRGLMAMVLIMLGVTASIVASVISNPSLRPIALENLISCLMITVIVSLLGIYVCQKFQALRRAVFDAQQVGQYRLMRRLGNGAMGEVYLAQHRLLHRPCAVKLIRPEQAGSEDWLLRFEREVQAMAQLTHPNTVEVYDFGRTEDDSFFYAMEYLPGKTLDALVRAHGPLPAGRVIYFLRQICGALAEAHDKGLVHRDVKPGNMIVCERGGAQDVVKILDFGLVHMQTDVGASETAHRPARPSSALLSRRPKRSTVEKGAEEVWRLTGVGQLLGTPAYMSPEQVRQEKPDARSDIYSLGGVAFYLLTGKPPFERDTLEALFRAHLEASPPRLRERLPRADPDLEEIIARCLEKSPERRFQTIGELAIALSATSAAAEWDSVKAES